MSLGLMMTATATTKRHPAISSNKRGDPVTNLESVNVTPVMSPSTRGQQAIRAGIGLEGTAIQIYEIYTQSHTHTDSSSSVTQMPDIVEGDTVTIDSVDYTVRWAEQQSATISMAAHLVIYITKDKRS